MKGIKTILIDDEPRGLTSLQKLLEINCPDVEIVAMCENAIEAKEKINQGMPQLVFMDIAMPEKNGFELLKELPAINFEIIFVTAHNLYMTQAFHFSAIDYLLKPVEDDLLKEAVQRAGKRIEGKAGSQNVSAFLHNVQQSNRVDKMKLCIQSLKGFQVVQIANIIYCEAAGNYTIFYLADEQHSICASRPIHEYEELLSDAGFLRVHKSYLINISHIKEYQRGEGGTVIMSNNFAAEVSRRRKEDFIAKMKEFFRY